MIQNIPRPRRQLRVTRGRPTASDGAAGRRGDGTDGAVLAAAGGIVNEPQTWDLLLRRTTVVWLKARPEDHWDRVVAQGDRRPMADSPDALAELRAMLAARERLYAQAHVVVDTHRRTAIQVATAVEARVR